MFPTKVLVAVDGSAAAEHAASETSKLCRMTGSELHVVHVAPVVSAWTGAEALAWQKEGGKYVNELEAHNLRQGHALLDEQLGKLSGSGDAASGSHLKVGRIDACVDELAEELGAGLVVVGSRGYGALRRALMGSVSLSLIHHAHCPVLVVRSREEREESGDERHPGISAGAILAAYDGSAESERASGAGAELAGAFEAEFHLASVVDMSQVIPYAPTYARIGWEEEIEKAEEETYKRLEEASDRIESSSGVRPTLHVLNGQPSAELVRLGDEIGAGLILVGSRGRGGIKRALLGSVSTSVAQHAGGSVLVFRPADTELGG